LSDQLANNLFVVDNQSTPLHFNQQKLPSGRRKGTTSSGGNAWRGREVV
jgi:hypothetical protein